MYPLPASVTGARAGCTSGPVLVRELREQHPIGITGAVWKADLLERSINIRDFSGSSHKLQTHGLHTFITRYEPATYLPVMIGIPPDHGVIWSLLQQPPLNPEERSGTEYRRVRPG
jgi:hypothetical protein